MTVGKSGIKYASWGRSIMPRPNFCGPPLKSQKKRGIKDKIVSSSKKVYRAALTFVLKEAGMVTGVTRGKNSRGGGNMAKGEQVWR